MLKSHRGFTIIELLIVIVIVAVLAAVSIVAYNGLQTRAYNTRIISGVKQYKNALLAYKAAYDKYPDFQSSVCLGEGYKDRDGNGNPDCGPMDYISEESSSFNTELKKIAKALPPIQTSPVIVPWSNPAVEYIGAQLTRWDCPEGSPLNTCFVVDGTPTAYFITYIVKGDNAKCGLPGIARTQDGATEWHDMQTTDSNSNTWSDTTVHHTTSCTLPLPNPA